MRTRLTLVLATLAVACADPPRETGFSSVADATSDVGDTTTTTGGTITATATDTDPDDSSGPDDPSTTTAPDPGSSSSAAEGTTAAAECGNGDVEAGEQCDDENDNEFDNCTSECQIPVCDDGEHNGDETDLDCGGSCQGCDICLVCDNNDDCADGMICSADEQCTIQASMSVDWAANCGGVIDGAVVEDLPAGTYLATAVSSAGTLWLPATHNPPSSGYFYEVECNAGVDLDMLATPAGIRYATIVEAFSNLIQNTQEFDFVGGDLVCYRTDATCGDNSGMVDFDLDYICPPAE